MAKRMMMCTVQLLLDLDDDAAACDALSEILRGVKEVKDWGYVKVGGQYLYPTERIVDSNYKEGDAFA